MTLKRAMGNINGLLEIFTKDTIRMIRGTFMEKCTGAMEVFIKVNGVMECKTDTEK